MDRLHQAMAWLTTLGGQVVAPHDQPRERSVYRAIEYRSGATRRALHACDDCASEETEALRLAS